MSLPQEGAKVATSIVDALKAQPLVLAVIVLNVIIFGAIVFAVRDQRDHEHTIMKTILEKCLKSAEITPLHPSEVANEISN